MGPVCSTKKREKVKTDSKFNYYTKGENQEAPKNDHDYAINLIHNYR